MHRQLRESLQGAEGFSDLVVVIFLDVRGFSSFAGMAESSEAAIFLRRMYIEIIDNYFPDSAFFKPTGDGLMIIRHFDRDSLTTEVENSLHKAMELVRDFPRISAADPMVNFEVPTSLGIGIARGAATRLASGDMTLDYSGRPLNLAARLMDLARPSGVVFDSRLVKGLKLTTSLLRRFDLHEVYLKGIADATPLQVYSSGGVTIPPHNRRPLEGVPFETARDVLKFKSIASRRLFIHRPPVEPVDANAVELVVEAPEVSATGAKGKTLSVTTIAPQEATKVADGWELVFDYTSMIKELTQDGVKPTWDVTLRLRYMVRGGLSEQAAMVAAVNRSW